MKPIIFFLSFLFICSFTGKDENPFSKKLRKKYTSIPSGEIMVNQVKKYVDGFYMMKTEVSNLDYKEFLAHLKSTDEKEKLELAKVYTDGWEAEPFQSTYFDHPAYEEYPVVNITKEAAGLYCQFLKEMLNKSDKLRGYKVVECRLPQRDEWILGARGGILLAPYPWGGYYLRNAKGQYLANFKRIGEGNVTYDYERKSYVVVEKGLVNTFALMPTPIYSFLPNNFDLYNMSGNVAEMIADKEVAVGGGWKSTGYDVRIESEMPFDRYSPEVGFRPILILEKE